MVRVVDGPRILVVNAGSSSIKFQLITMPAARRAVRGQVERIGEGESTMHLVRDAGGEARRALVAPDHEAALSAVFQTLAAEERPDRGATLTAIGHRVVHAGGEFSAPVLVDDQVLARLEVASRLAPLHNAASLAGIRAARRHFPELPQVAVFDTDFHHELPDHARYYALPLSLQRERRIRRYGFHGLSHRFVAVAAAEWMGRKPSELRIVSLHLGNGASACAIHRGRSVDTSMGFTPLEGLVMGSRSGDLDPALPGYLQQELELSDAALSELLNRGSGLAGLCGQADMREVERLMAGGDADARLAFDVFCYRAKKYVGAYYAVFTAGIGQYSQAVRAAVCAGMGALGIAVDPVLNAAASGGIAEISLADAPVKVLVIPTDEELEIAREVYRTLKEGSHEYAIADDP
jgi:acetate kinase